MAGSWIGTRQRVSSNAHVCLCVRVCLVFHCWIFGTCCSRKVALCIRACKFICGCRANLANKLTLGNYNLNYLNLNLNLCRKQIQPSASVSEMRSALPRRSPLSPRRFDHRSQMFARGKDEHRNLRLRHLHLSMCHTRARSDTSVRRRFCYQRTTPSHNANSTHASTFS